MLQTVKAVIDELGLIRPVEPIQLTPGREVLVTILDEVAPPKPNDAALLSEIALSDWNRLEEDEAWAEFQQAP